MSNWVHKRAAKYGFKIIDADAPLVVSVTALDIRRGTQKNAKCCPLAMACRRSFNVRGAYFLRSTAYLEREDDTIVRYRLPKDLQAEIVNFDRHGEMDARAYVMDAPTASREPAKQREYAKRSKAKKKRSKAKRTTSRPQRPRQRLVGIRTSQEPANF